VKRAIGASSAIALVLAAIAAPGAGAATEFGSDCAANASEPNVTVVQLQKVPGSALPLTAPGAGVLTAWTVWADPSAFVEESDRLKLMVFRSQTNPSKLETIGESAEETVAHGTNSFKTRIPVQAGDRLGLYGPNSPGTLICSTGAVEDEIGILRAPAPLGSTNTFPPGTKDQVPVSATLEPDKDGDGYGDETQDGCPQSAAYHETCPTVTFKAHAAARKKSIVVRVGVSSEALIDVYGQVGWGYKPSPKLKTAGSKPTRLIVSLSGPKKTVLPGKQVPFRVPLRKAVLRRLGKLTPKESLTAKLTVSCTDLAGHIKHQRLDVKLQGQEARGS
jgi:hypothetical protein